MFSAGDRCYNHVGKQIDRIPKKPAESKIPLKRKPILRRLKLLLATTPLLLLLVPGWLAYRRVRSAIEEPQAILVLGGAIHRETRAAELARENLDLEIWVSSGTNPEYAEEAFVEAGIDLDRVRLDYRAVDTVTNFTTLADEFKKRGITNLYLVTSDYHMRRAFVIGEIVLGSRGIRFRPVAVSTGEPNEPITKVARDGVRAVLWVATGYTGASLAERVKIDRAGN